MERIYRKKQRITQIRFFKELMHKANGELLYMVKYLSARI